MEDQPNRPEHVPMIPDRANSPNSPPPPAEDGKAANNSVIKRELDERLDEALEETFPGSDSIAVTPPTRPGKRRQGQHVS